MARFKMKLVACLPSESTEQQYILQSTYFLEKVRFQEVTYFCFIRNTN